jgi:hypothetical protein
MTCLVAASPQKGQRYERFVTLRLTSELAIINKFGRRQTRPIALPGWSLLLGSASRAKWWMGQFVSIGISNRGCSNPGYACDWVLRKILSNLLNYVLIPIKAVAHVVDHFVA